ncbi:hypothetical protein PGT21_000581 [Puccinia graminis f. sp. tritici]|uniref:Uncharacterized protein n=1 Tax=Puccinia graminis f. sp. tritici TaxID=56615 RepID=A0A5B0R058_PUCGR|nr:hypothetical protein PGT21_000581 [Puccinia graminis f. sp. tritici]
MYRPHAAEAEPIHDPPPHTLPKQSTSPHLHRRATTNPSGLYSTPPTKQTHYSPPSSPVLNLSRSPTHSRILLQAPSPHQILSGRRATTSLATLTDHLDITHSARHLIAPNHVLNLTATISATSIITHQQTLRQFCLSFNSPFPQKSALPLLTHSPHQLTYQRPSSQSTNLTISSDSTADRRATRTTNLPLAQPPVTLPLIRSTAELVLQQLSLKARHLCRHQQPNIALPSPTQSVILLEPITLPPPQVVAQLPLTQTLFSSQPSVTSLPSDQQINRRAPASSYLPPIRSTDQPTSTRFQPRPSHQINRPAAKHQPPVTSLPSDQQINRRAPASSHLPPIRSTDQPTSTRFQPPPSHQINRPAAKHEPPVTSLPSDQPINRQAVSQLKLLSLTTRQQVVARLPLTKKLLSSQIPVTSLPSDQQTSRRAPASSHLPPIRSTDQQPSSKSVKFIFPLDSTARRRATTSDDEIVIKPAPFHLPSIRSTDQPPSSRRDYVVTYANYFHLNTPVDHSSINFPPVNQTNCGADIPSAHPIRTPITMMFTPESTPLRNPAPAGTPANTTVTQFLPPHAYQKPSQLSNHQTKSSIIPIGTHPATPAPDERPVEPPEGSQSVTEVQYMVESMQVRCGHLKRVHARFSGRAPNLDTFHQAYVDALKAFVTEGTRKLEEAELAEQTHISVPVDVSSACKTFCSTEGVSSSPAQSELTIPDNGSDVQAQPHDPHLQVACTRQPSEFSVAPMDLDQAWQLLKNGTTTNINKLWPISAFPLPSEQITDPVDRFVDLDQTKPTRIQEGTSNSSIVTIRRSTPVDSTSILLLGGPQLKRTLSCQSLVSTEAVLGRSVKRIKSFDHGTQHLIESRRPSEDTRAQANLSQHETHPQTESHLNENAASLEPSDMECSDDEANPQESAADSQASSHSSDLVVRPKNPVTTKNHHQSPKSALPLDDLPTTEQAKSAPLGSKSTSISTSSPATSGDPSDDSAAPRTDKTLELPSDSPAVQHRTSQPQPQ